jgi:hypothetical protein
MTGHQDEARFEAACYRAIEECRALRPSYVPTTWIRMIEQHGAFEAACRLVVSGDLQDGFLRLVRAGRRDLTIEHAVGLPEWSELFRRRPDVLEAAAWRLRQG